MESDWHRSAERSPHAQLFRSAFHVRIFAYWVYLATCWTTFALGILDLNFKSMAVITVAETTVLLLCRPLAADSRKWALGYLLFEGLCQTATFHVLGPIRIVAGPVVYLFQLFNPGVSLGRTGLLIVANVFVAYFLLLGLVESSGLLTTYGTHALIMSDDLLYWGSPLIVFIVLNLFAWYPARLKEERDRAAGKLLESNLEFAEEVKRRTEDLERSYRALEMKGEEHRRFVYTITHDLKGPFTNVLLAIGLVERSSRDARDCAENLELIGREAERGLVMLQDLLEFFEVRERIDHPSWVDLGALVEEAQRQLTAQVNDKGIETFIGPLPAVWADRSKLQRVVGNLLSNAVKYAPRRGGRITVRSSSESGQVLLHVEDNGIGIAPEYHARIFEMFGRAPTPLQGYSNGNRVEGSGIGLALVRQIVEDLGGCVMVESAPGRGSRFTIRLPVEKRGSA